MKGLLTKITGSKMAKRIGATYIALQGYAVSAMAAQPNQDGYGMVEKVIDMLTTYARYIGALAAVYGLIAVIFAIKGNNAEGQTSAIMWIVCGFMLCSIKSIMTFVGILN